MVDWTLSLLMGHHLLIIEISYMMSKGRKDNNYLVKHRLVVLIVEELVGEEELVGVEGWLGRRSLLGRILLRRRS